MAFGLVVAGAPAASAADAGPLAVLAPLGSPVTVPPTVNVGPVAIPTPPLPSASATTSPQTGVGIS
ncbi:MAG TPA: hypothetical protein VGT98_04640, partial [Candidatus Elarobacter sp.]|nr:hypothetical protein [Candidatus Elarobacter sp.]